MGMKPRYKVTKIIWILLAVFLVLLSGIYISSYWMHCRFEGAVGSQGVSVNPMGWTVPINKSNSQSQSQSSNPSVLAILPPATQTQLGLGNNNPDTLKTIAKTPVELDNMLTPPTDTENADVAPPSNLPTKTAIIVKRNVVKPSPTPSSLTMTTTEEGCGTLAESCDESTFNADLMKANPIYDKLYTAYLNVKSDSPNVGGTIQTLQTQVSNITVDGAVASIQAAIANLSCNNPDTTSAANHLCQAFSQL